MVLSLLLQSLVVWSFEFLRHSGCFNESAPWLPLLDALRPHRVTILDRSTVQSYAWTKRGPCSKTGSVFEHGPRV